MSKFSFRHHVIDEDLPPGMYAQTALADLDGDGVLEYVLGQRGGSLFCYKYAAPDRWTRTVIGQDSPSDVGACVLDVDGDGRLDLVSANLATNTVSVLLDNGAGGYNTPSTWNTGASPRGMGTADFDGDGKVDLVVTNSTASSVTVLYGNGDGTFPTSFTFNVGVSPQSVVVVDLNGDGKPDIGTANFGGSNVTVLRNNGEELAYILSQVRARGFCHIRFAEYREGGLAVPLVVGGRVVGGIIMRYIKSTLKVRQLEEDFFPILRGLAEDISAAYEARLSRRKLQPQNVLEDVVTHDVDRLPPPALILKAG